MIKRTRAEITKCIIHKVANKYNSGQNSFSEATIRFDEESYNLMLPFLLKPFANLSQSFRFSHHADIRLNEMNNYASNVFKDEESFIENSKNIVNHLYEQSNSAQIKKGDLIFWKGHVAITLNKRSLVHAYGPKKKVLIMPITKTINLLQKKNLKILSIKRP